MKEGGEGQGREWRDGKGQGQGRSQYEARRGNCLVLFSSATIIFVLCSAIRLTSILINSQVATENTINFDVCRYYNYKHSNNL